MRCSSLERGRDAHSVDETEVEGRGHEGGEAHLELMISDPPIWSALRDRIGHQEDTETGTATEQASHHELGHANPEQMRERRLSTQFMEADSKDHEKCHRGKTAERWFVAVASERLAGHGRLQGKCAIGHGFGKAL